ncbi:MAG: NAD(P)/FAD-dependent oxidoreductase [Thermomicrobiales bacterium]
MTGADAEVIVVGGGPAGSVTAALLAARGHRVLLFDKARFPRHKACSEYINPAGARLLHRLGLAADLERLGAHRMEGMLIHAPGGARFLADFLAVPDGNGAVGLSRYHLDTLLLDRARAAGVEVREGAHVRGLIMANGAVHGVEISSDGMRERVRAPLTIGADGRHGVVARTLHLSRPLSWLRRTGLVAHYRGVRGLDRWGEMHVTSCGYAGLAPLEDGLANVALVTASDTISGRDLPLEEYFARGLAAIPALAAKLASAERVGGIRGVGPMAQRAQRVAGDGFLLVGDAASFLDPFTGDGIAEALLGATLAAPIASAALQSGKISARFLAPYVAARERAFRSKRAVAWLVQGFIANSSGMDYAVSRLAVRPDDAITLAGVLGGIAPASAALSPRFLARLLRP